MSPDPTSLDRLYDIVVPAPALWWPPAPGWLWLLGALVVIALALGLRAFARWQQNRYRREALSALAALQAAATDVTVLLRGMAEILKRTALTAYPRIEVAALTGPAWFEFLDRTGDTRFSNGLGNSLEQATYLGRADGTDIDVRALADEVRTWIRRHGPMPA